MWVQFTKYKMAFKIESRAKTLFALTTHLMGLGPIEPLASHDT
jgi:hypothetical protein